MNKHSTLWILVVLCLASAGFRWKMGTVHEDYDDGLFRHQESYRSIRGMVDDVSARRRQVIMGDAQEFILGYLNDQARRVHLGQVNAPEKQRGKSLFTDHEFRIEFETGKDVVSREALAGFLFNVESQKRTMRLRTTHLKVRPDTGDPRMRRGVAKGADRGDSWKVDELAFTRRLPREKDKKDS